jgi:hypothetical protein
MADTAADLAIDIRSKRGTGQVSRSILQVDDRVLARVTDGIYRRPSSAFRELISNAYDADAKSVIIHTDAPRFERIVIKDDGNGMSPETLADLVKHIGGSSKRTKRGKRLMTVDQSDSRLTPKGRRLIGKIGIGLFSVAQLTQHFQIITKREGDDYRTSADVVLKTHTEDLLGGDDEQPFETGSVAITSEPAEAAAHGTEIILMDVRPQAKALLQSLDRWGRLDDPDEDEATVVTAPTFHIGRVKADDPGSFLELPVLPWARTDSPEARFKKLYHAVREEVRTRKATPNIEESLDQYLGMLWNLSLAVPVRYIDRHPFELTADDGIGFFQLTGKRSGAEPVEPEPGQTIGAKLGLSSHQDPVGGFSVNIDGVELLRPVAFDNELLGNSEIGRPLMFFAKVKSGLGAVPSTIGGGALSFEAYFYWNQKITPKENNGVLVRINNASGLLFDKAFLDYQVAELTRLRQLMSEVFITEGLDAALNIDRESFNFSHPHYQYLQKWVHFAVRQTTNRLKGLNKDLLTKRRESAVSARVSALDHHATAVWTRLRGANGDSPPDVLVLPKDEFEQSAHARKRGVVVLNQDAITTGLNISEIANFNERAVALAQVLSAYGLMSENRYEEQERLISDILTIFAVQ